MTGGRRLVFSLGALFEFWFPCAGAMVLAFPFAFGARLALPFVFRFRLAGWLLFAFELSLAFLFAGLRFGLLSFVFVFELVALLFSGFLSVLELSLDFVAVGVSPSLMGRLMSTATVCPTLTIFPGSGTWIKTVSGLASPPGRVARTRKFKPAELIVFSADIRSLPTMSGTFVSELRNDK